MKRPAPRKVKVTIPEHVRIITIRRPSRTVTRFLVEPVYVRFGQFVKETRLQLGWNQQTLSEKMNMSRGSIANIEVGRQRILLDDVWKFAKVLRTTPKIIFNLLLRD